MIDSGPVLEQLRTATRYEGFIRDGARVSSTLPTGSREHAFSGARGCAIAKRRVAKTNTAIFANSVCPVEPDDGDSAVGCPSAVPGKAGVYVDCLLEAPFALFYRELAGVDFVGLALCRNRGDRVRSQIVIPRGIMPPPKVGRDHDQMLALGNSKYRLCARLAGSGSDSSKHNNRQPGQQRGQRGSPPREAVHQLIRPLLDMTVDPRHRPRCRRAPC